MTMTTYSIGDKVRLVAIHYGPLKIGDIVTISHIEKPMLKNGYRVLTVNKNGKVYVGFDWRFEKL